MCSRKRSLRGSVVIHSQGITASPSSDRLLAGTPRLPASLWVCGTHQCPLPLPPGLEPPLTSIAAEAAGAPWMLPRYTP